MSKYAVVFSAARFPSSFVSKLIPSNDISRYCINFPISESLALSNTLEMATIDRKRLVDLPFEILEQLCFFLEKSSLAALRLTCKRLQVPPERWLMAEICLELHAEPIQKLQSLSQHPRFAEHVHKLHIDTTFYRAMHRESWDYKVNRWKSDKRVRQQDSIRDVRLAQYRNTLTPSQVDACYKEFRNAVSRQTAFFAKSPEEIYAVLSEVIGHFPKLESIEFCDGCHSKYHVLPDQEKASLWKTQFQTLRTPATQRKARSNKDSKVAAIILAALKSPGPPRAIALHGVWTCTLVALHELSAEGSLSLRSEMPSIRALCLRALFSEVVTNRDDEGIANDPLDREASRSIASVDTIIAMSINLEHLEYRHRTCRQPVLSPTDGSIALSKLQRVTLMDLYLSAVDVTRMTRASQKTLKEIYLRSCDLKAGSWVDVFLRFREDLHLDKLVLERCLIENSGEWVFDGKPSCATANEEPSLYTRFLAFVLHKSDTSPLVPSREPDAEEQWEQASDRSMKREHWAHEPVDDVIVDDDDGSSDYYVEEDLSDIPGSP